MVKSWLTKSQLIVIAEKDRASNKLMREHLEKIRSNAIDFANKGTFINNLWLIQSITEILTREEERRK